MPREDHLKLFLKSVKYRNVVTIMQNISKLIF